MIGYKSFWAGVTSYRSPPYGIGLIFSVASGVSIVKGLFSLTFDGIIGAFLKAYNKAIVSPILKALAFLGIEISPSIVHFFILWGLFGTALARTKLGYRAERAKEALSSPHLFGDRSRFTFRPEKPSTKAAFWYLFRIKMKQSERARQRPLWLRILRNMELRLDFFEQHAPEYLKIASDIVLFPIAFLLFLREPILAILDNGNNPEDSSVALVSTRDIARHQRDFDEGRSWIRYLPLQDFRKFFVGQLLVVVALTVIPVLAASDTAK